MAYERINWKNKPDTATPINADNLNKMDKGIKDLEEGKVSKTDLVQTDQVNNPEKVPSSTVTHALGQEIDTLNNNLADETMSAKGTSSFIDANTILKNGVHSFYMPGDDYETYNYPLRYGVLVVFDTGTSYIIQLVFPVGTDLTSNIHVRSAINRGETWSPWKELSLT